MRAEINSLSTRRFSRPARCLGIAALLATGLALAAPAPSRIIETVGADGSLGGFEAKFIDVDGVRTRYYDVGTGEVMLLVHGSGFDGTSSANTWSLNIPGLSKRFRVIAADKLASGMTGNPASDDDLSIAGEVQHMYGFVKALQVKQVHLIGQSRGSGLALLFAVAHPELVKTLVLVDSATAAPPAGDDRNKRRDRLFAGCPDKETPQGDQFRCEQSALYYDPAPVSDGFVSSAAYMWNQPKAQETRKRMTAAVRKRNETISSEMTQQAYHKILTEDVLQMPTLIYWGKNDPSVLPEQGYALYNIIAESNPRAWMLFTNRGGHFHYREHPQEFNTNAINFVTAWGGSGH
jgi:2-hydroxy-6-oxonona-2,4-dienedioate hydrolase